MLNNKRPDPRMKDIELALRFFAFQYNIEQYDGNLKTFLDSTCELLNNSWNEKNEEIKELFFQLEQAIAFSYELFPKNPFSRYNKGSCNNKFNRAIFELFSYYFSNPQIRNCISGDKEGFINEFVKLNDDIDFISAVSDTTKDFNRMFIRYNKFLELLLKFCVDKKIKISKFILTNNKIKIEKVIS